MRCNNLFLETDFSTDILSRLFYLMTDVSIIGPKMFSLNIRLNEIALPDLHITGVYPKEKLVIYVTTVNQLQTYRRFRLALIIFSVIKPW